MIDFSRLIEPLRNRVINLVTRAVVGLVDDSHKLQELQVSGLEDDDLDEVERFQNYGFTSVPKEGAEAVLLRLGGRGDHPIVIAVDDRRYRILNLVSGEVAVYTSTGSRIVLKDNGDIELTPSSGVVKLTGDLNVSGTVTAITDVVGSGVSLKSHTHAAGTLLTGASPGDPVTGTTGGPL